MHRLSPYVVPLMTVFPPIRLVPLMTVCVPYVVPLMTVFPPMACPPHDCVFPPMACPPHDCVSPYGLSPS